MMIMKKDKKKYDEDEEIQMMQRPLRKPLTKEIWKEPMSSSKKSFIVIQ